MSTPPKVTFDEARRLLDRFSMREDLKAETLEQLNLPGERNNAVELEAVEFAFKFWKILVKKVGELKARDILRRLTSDKKMGRREEPGLAVLIYAHVRVRGLNDSAEQIAKRILKNKPYYVVFESGKYGLVDGEFITEAKLGGQTIIRKMPLKKELKALKKQVERIRRQMIEDGILPKVYSPRTYYRG
jgi:hypothetical protein